MNVRHRLGIIALLWLVSAVVFTTALATDWMRVWGALGIPSMSPSFADLRTITGGLESSKLGADPLRDNPMDPWTRTLNYPRVWLHLFRILGVNDVNLPLVGLFFSVAYLAGISLLVWRAGDVVLAGAIGVCVLSGSSLLAMERGNNDLLIFALVLCAVLSRSVVAGAVSIGSAIMLKLYPVAALAHFATARDRPRRGVAWALLAASLLVIGVSARDLLSIAGGTPSSFRLSYGVLSLRAGCGEVASRWGWIAERCGGWPLSLSGGALLAALSLVTVLVAWRVRSRWTSEEPRGMAADLFVAFAAIYAFTYFGGSNWDYRLIFLIPTLPFFRSLARLDGTRWLGWASVLLVPVAMNAGLVLAGPWTYLGHLAKAGLAFVCLFLLVTLARARLTDMGGLAAGPPSPPNARSAPGSAWSAPGSPVRSSKYAESF